MYLSLYLHSVSNSLTSADNSINGSNAARLARARLPLLSSSTYPLKMADEDLQMELEAISSIYPEAQIDGRVAVVPLEEAGRKIKASLRIPAGYPSEAVVCSVDSNLDAHAQGQLLQAMRRCAADSAADGAPALMMVLSAALETLGAVQQSCGVCLDAVAPAADDHLLLPDCEHHVHRSCAFQWFFYCLSARLASDSHTAAVRAASQKQAAAAHAVGEQEARMHGLKAKLQRVEDELAAATAQLEAATAAAEAAAAAAAATAAAGKSSKGGGGGGKGKGQGRGSDEDKQQHDPAYPPVVVLTPAQAQAQVKQVTAEKKALQAQVHPLQQRLRALEEEAAAAVAEAAAAGIYLQPDGTSGARSSDAVAPYLLLAAVSKASDAHAPLSCPVCRGPVAWAVCASWMPPLLRARLAATGTGAAAAAAAAPVDRPEDHEVHIEDATTAAYLQRCRSLWQREWEKQAARAALIAADGPAAAAAATAATAATAAAEGAGHGEEAAPAPAAAASTAKAGKSAAAPAANSASSGGGKGGGGRNRR